MPHIRIVHEDLSFQAVIGHDLDVVLRIGDPNQRVIEIILEAGGPGVEQVGGSAVVVESHHFVHPDKPSQSIGKLHHWRVEVRGVGGGVVLIKDPGDQRLVDRSSGRAIGMDGPNRAQRRVIFHRRGVRGGEVETDEAAVFMKRAAPIRGFDVLEIEQFFQ
jgi:hypothetical protein